MTYIINWAGQIIEQGSVVGAVVGTGIGCDRKVGVVKAVDVDKQKASVDWTYSAWGYGPDAKAKENTNRGHGWIQVNSILLVDHHSLDHKIRKELARRRDGICL